MENTTTLHEHTIKGDVEDYIETKIDLIKLKTIDKTGSAVSGIIVGVVSAILGLFILQFLSFSAAYAISSATGHPYLGFLCVAGFYILLTVLLILLKEKLVTMPIINALLSKFYTSETQEE
ncbi:MAG: phage holin family protein [Bacteroidetes bacterium]|nr:phage holin family protein [Bacteroidota bacterium]